MNQIWNSTCLRTNIPMTDGRLHILELHFLSHLHLMVTLMYVHWVVRGMHMKDCGMLFPVETVYIMLQ